MPRKKKTAQLIDLDRLQEEISAEAKFNESKAYQLKCQLSFIDYCKHMFPDPEHYDDTSKSRFDVALHHKVLARTLEKVESGEISHLIVDMPPRHGKTEQISKLFPTWVMGKNPTQSAILATYNQTYAEDIGRAVKEYFLNDRYQAVFPEIKPAKDSKSASRLKLVQGGQISFAGAGGSITGRGGHLLIGDDLIKDAVQAESALYRDRLWAWLTSVFLTRAMTQDARVCLVMTRWHEDDPIGRLTDPKNPNYDPEIAQLFQHLHIRALAGENDPLGRKPGEALWPARFNKEWLERQKRLNPQAFSALYQGEPTPEDGTYFQSKWIHTYSRKELPRLENLKFYAASDHAVGTDIGKKHDKTVLLMAGVDERGHIWLVDCFWGSANSKKVVEIMLNMMEKWNPVYWWAEDGHITKAIGPWLMKRRIERGVPGIIDTVTPTKNKVQRSQSIQALMADGRVHFPRWAPWFTEAKDQLIKFPNGAHDDFVDALAWLGYKVMQIIAKRGLSSQPSVKPGTWGWWKKQIEFERQQTTGGRQGW